MPNDAEVLANADAALAALTDPQAQAALKVAIERLRELVAAQAEAAKEA